MGRSEKTAGVWTQLDGLHPFSCLPETKPCGSKGIYLPSKPLKLRLANLTTFGVERICSRERFLHSPRFSKARGKAHVQPGLSAAALFDFESRSACGQSFSPLSPPSSFTLGTGRGQAEAKTRGSLFLCLCPTITFPPRSWRRWVSLSAPKRGRRGRGPLNGIGWRAKPRAEGVTG